MIIVPSTLGASYRQEDLEHRLSLALGEHARFLQSTGQKLPTTWHLDFVLPGFAAAKQVDPSLNLKQFFETLKQKWPLAACLQIHLMGLDADMIDVLDFFETFEFQSEWTFRLLMPDSWIPYFLKLEGDNENVQVGIWYDLGQWPEDLELEEAICLLMTVEAGRSGQKLTEEIRERGLKIATENPNTEIILDGGWSVDFESPLDNLCVVSDSSFWKKFITNH